MGPLVDSIGGTWEPEGPGTPPEASMGVQTGPELGFWLRKPQSGLDGLRQAETEATGWSPAGTHVRPPDPVFRPTEFQFGVPSPTVPPAPTTDSCLLLPSGYL